MKNIQILFIFTTCALKIKCFSPLHNDCKMKFELMVPKIYSCVSFLKKINTFDHIAVKWSNTLSYSDLVIINFLVPLSLNQVFSWRKKPYCSLWRKNFAGVKKGKNGKGSWNRNKITINHVLHKCHSIKVIKFPIFMEY